MKKKTPLFSLTHNPAFIISLILFVGLIFAADSADITGLKNQGLATLSSSKIFRIVTVLIAGALAFFVLIRSKNNGTEKLISGNTCLVTIYAILAIMTVVFSQLKSMTLFKGTEMFVIAMICAIAASSYKNNSSAFIKGIMWLYSISSLSALIELSVFGTMNNRQLVGATPLLDSMLQSTYPPLVGNGLGFLGGVTGLFGVYLYDSNDISGFSGKIIATFISLIGVAVLFLSYTRSTLVFFLLCVLLYAFIEKKFLRIALIMFMMLGALATPTIQEKISSHMRKGSTDEQIETMSGRTEFWRNIFARDPVQLLVGEGFATGTLFQNYSNNSQEVFKYRNAHNSIAEIIMSIGVVGAMIWLTLLFRIYKQLQYSRKRLIRSNDIYKIKFHNFVYVLFVFSLMRSLMNSTFVYLDYFIFLLISIAAYAEITKAYVNNLGTEEPNLETAPQPEQKNSPILAHKK